jgi:small subunit ribosomal protein S17
MREAMRKQKVGRVVSTKMDKTVVVAVDYLKPHPLYRKIIRKASKFHAHDASNDCRIGDTVRIGETRPLSKTKRWEVVEVIERGEEE